jgi:FixJ family two-component response regulator
VNSGELYRFLTKPWDDDELIEAVREAFRHHARRTMS